MQTASYLGIFGGVDTTIEGKHLNRACLWLYSFENFPYGFRLSVLLIYAEA